ncbi:kinase-like domain-containing protein [Xylariaceae sp. FL1651]|nr:kinase-like domain-containing protein [Xylariaceae sp. FL1651]
MDLEICENNAAFIWEDDDLKFDHTKVIFKSKNEEYFYAITPDRLNPNREVDLSKLKLIPIPMNDVSPPFSASFTQAPEPPSDLHYIKTPSLLPYDGSEEVSRDISAQVLTEIAACEVLMKHPHPNIATYFGCIAKDGRVMGLCFAKYPRTLPERMRMPIPFDVHPCQQAIRKAVEHMHQHGLIHNDLNPANIMIDNSDNPVIIDFDSCKPEGAELGVKGGTHGWTKDDSKYAVRQNDLFALERIDEYLMQFKK